MSGGLFTSIYIPSQAYLPIIISPNSYHFILSRNAGSSHNTTVLIAPSLSRCLDELQGAVQTTQALQRFAQSLRLGCEAWLLKDGKSGPLSPFFKKMSQDVRYHPFRAHCEPKLHFCLSWKVFQNSELFDVSFCQKSWLTPCPCDSYNDHCCHRGDLDCQDDNRRGKVERSL